MKKKITPSKFYFVHRDTSINQCVELMREKSLSFVLIEDSDQNLVGIFTLKDLLKSFHHLTKSKHLSKPIAVVMTRPVFTIPAHQIHKAPVVMAQKKIRHLPVTSIRKQRGARVIGVVDIESLLKTSLQKNAKDVSKEICVYSGNGSFLGFLKKILREYSLLKVDKLWASKIKSEKNLEILVSAYDLFFCDVVDQRDLVFASVLGTYAEAEKKPLIVLVEPDFFKEKLSKKTLESLSKLARVRVYEKPINVHDIIYECLS